MDYQNTTDHSTTQSIIYEFDDPVQRTIIAICFIVVVVLGIPGNSLVLFAVAASRKLQTSTNAFVVNLAISDLISCLFVPTHVVVILSEGLSLEDALLCKVSGAIAYITFMASVMNLALIAFNRYYLITRQRTDYDQLYSSRNILAMIFSTWVYVAVASFIPSWLGLGDFGFSKKFRSCTIDTSNPLVKLNDLVRTLLIQLPSLIVISVCYGSIYVFLRKHGIFDNIRRSLRSRDLQQSDIATARNHQVFVKVTKNLFITVVAYIICIIPFAAVSPIPETDAAIPWVAMLLVVNSCVNPMIYGFNHPHFKEVFGVIIRCKFRDIPEPSKFLKRVIPTQFETEVSQSH